MEHHTHLTGSLAIRRRAHNLRLILDDYGFYTIKLADNPGGASLAVAAPLP